MFPAFVITFSRAPDSLWELSFYIRSGLNVALTHHNRSYRDSETKEKVEAQKRKQIGGNNRKRRATINLYSLFGIYVLHITSWTLYQKVITHFQKTLLIVTPTSSVITISAMYTSLENFSNAGGLLLNTDLGTVIPGFPLTKDLVFNKLYQMSDDEEFNNLTKEFLEIFCTGNF